MGFLGKDDQGVDTYEGSRVVVTECRDTLYSMIPELYRVFTSSEEAVAFDPQQPEDVEGAEQATHYANYVWSEVNDGEALLNTALLDWGVKFAAFKIWWEEVPERRTHHFSGLSDLAVQMLQTDDEVVELEADPQQVQAFVQQAMPDGGAMSAPVPQTLWSGKLVRETRRGKICIRLIPPEDLDSGALKEQLSDAEQRLSECEKGSAEENRARKDRDRAEAFLSIAGG
jgi:hypothetical protein